MVVNILTAVALTASLLFSATSPAGADNSLQPKGELDESGSILPRGGPYTADPTARVFGDTLYVYTSTDHPSGCSGKGLGGSNFCMPGYKVYSTKDMKSWKTSKGLILGQHDVPWASKDFRMWAPDVVKKGSTYYMFFPHKSKIGVATSKSPDGKFKARETKIENSTGIDPSVILIDGQWYLYTSRKGPGDTRNEIYVSKLDNEFKRAGKPIKISGLKEGYKEGPHVYKRGDTFYMLYARVGDGGYRLELAKSKNPTKSFISAGEAVPRFQTSNHGSAPTNHGSIVDFKGKSYVFYHRHLNKKITKGDPIAFKYRTAVYDRICYSKNGNIIPSVHGHNSIKSGKCAGSAPASSPSSSGPLTIQGESPESTTGEARGLNTHLAYITNGSSATYPTVNLSNYSRVQVSYASKGIGGTLELRSGNKNGKIIAKFYLPNTGDWRNYRDTNMQSFNLNGKAKIVAVFKSSKSNEEYLFNIDSIKFLK